jgi:hypothetical protein
MRVIGLLIIMLLAFGMAWGPTPAIAQDDVVFQQLEPITNTDLAQVRGKQLPPNRGVIFLVTPVMQPESRCQRLAEKFCTVYSRLQTKVFQRSGLELPNLRFCIRPE